MSGAEPGSGNHPSEASSPSEAEPPGADRPDSADSPSSPRGRNVTPAGEEVPGAGEDTEAPVTASGTAEPPEGTRGRTDAEESGAESPEACPDGKADCIKVNPFRAIL